MDRLDGHTAIVTGAGRGIGRATALRLAAEGANVVVTARTRSEIDDTAAKIRELGAGALAIAGDVALEAHARETVDAALAEFGGVDILVNNAGMGARSPVYATPVDEWDRVIAVNLRGAFLFARTVAPNMIEKREGAIVSISSAAGLRGFPVHGMGA